MEEKAGLNPVTPSPRPFTIREPTMMVIKTECPQRTFGTYGTYINTHWMGIMYNRGPMGFILI